MIEIRVDGQPIAVCPGANLLEACLAAGIYIPHLCHLPGLPAAASCRLCFVALGDRPDPVPACTVAVQPGLEVLTDTPAVRRLQRSALELLLSAHTIDCRRCPANRRCALQRIARFLKVPLKRPDLPPLDPPGGLPGTGGELVVDPSHCVLCGRCVRTCRRLHGHSRLTFAGRGQRTVVTDWVETGPAIRCTDCGACIEVCPVGAIRLAPGANDPES
jgi:NADH dehydrogenase/NADH:ubiquinone oxidoreductase subunit G